MYSHSTFPAQPNNKPKDISDTTLVNFCCYAYTRKHVAKGWVRLKIFLKNFNAAKNLAYLNIRKLLVR